jgi:hypothetical protein
MRSPSNHSSTLGPGIDDEDDEDDDSLFNQNQSHPIKNSSKEETSSEEFENIDARSMSRPGAYTSPSFEHISNSRRESYNSTPTSDIWELPIIKGSRLLDRSLSLDNTKGVNNENGR